MRIWEIVLVVLAAVPSLLLLRYLLPRVPLISCRCTPSSSPWSAEAEDYGLHLTEDDARKRLRVGRAQDRFRRARGVRSAARAARRRP